MLRRKTLQCQICKTVDDPSSYVVVGPIQILAFLNSNKENQSGKGFQDIESIFNSWEVFSKTAVFKISALPLITILTGGLDLKSG